MKYLICSIIKNEHKYLKEWIEHHLSIGFDNIYLFEDYGSESHKEITDNYPLVILTKCDDYFTIKRDYDIGCHRQTRLYLKFLNEHHIEGWCAFIDIDEYIFLNDNYTLDSLISGHESNTGIALFWKLYNANGHIFSADNIVNTYTKICNNISLDKGWSFKSFVNLQVAKVFNSQHEINGLVDVYNNNISEVKYNKPNYDKVLLNHYFTKSYEDWCYRFVRGDLAPNHRKFDAFFENNPEMRKYKYYKHIINRKRFKDFISDELVSVCMCTYNRASFLDNVIANILNQTYTNLEFVIVDDGSTDNSKEILDKWCEKDSRVRVIYSDHNFCKSRNLSYKEAKGNYIVNIDSDDECSLDRIEKQYKYLQEHKDVDIVGSLTSGLDRNVAHFENHNDIIANYTTGNNEMVVFGTMMIRKLLLDKFTHDFFFSAFNGGGEDTIFKFCCLNYGAKFANIQEYLYHYNLGTQSMTHHTNYKASFFDKLIFTSKGFNDVLQKVKKFLEEGNIEQQIMSYSNNPLPKKPSVIKKKLIPLTNKSNLSIKEQLFCIKPLLVVCDGNVPESIDTDDVVVMFNRMPNYHKVNKCDIWFVDLHKDFFKLADFKKLRKIVRNVKHILIPSTNSYTNINTFCEKLSIDRSKIIKVSINPYLKCDDSFGEGVFTTSYLYIKYMLSIVKDPLHIIGLDIKNRYNILSNHSEFKDSWHINALKQEEKELCELLKKGIIYDS